MELLAPAGSFAAFEAALAEGADSVYVGAPGLNARALSRDFTLAEIDSMIQQAHRIGVKLYIAMNSLVKEDELPRAIEALACFAELGPDALIIQDLGLLYLARTWFPELALHASTLMSVHNSMAARELTGLGFERVVLARELTIEEMAGIHHRTDAELEVFIHGAMCFSYSGLCMFSSLHGGKSSLRGQCVQPCRRHYAKTAAGRGRGGGRSTKGGSYLFSMNDLCGVDVLPELHRAGISCLKIEGRMKSASYVANTVAAYRLALNSMDLPEDEQEPVLREAHRLLDDAMARKRAPGFLLADQPREAISPERSGSSGSLLGRFRGLVRQRGRDGRYHTSVQLVLSAPVSEGDRLRLHEERSGERISFTLRSLQVHGRRKKTARAGEQVRIGLGSELKNSGQDVQGSLYKVDVGSRITSERSGRRRSKKLAGRRISADRRLVEEILDHLSWKPAAAPSRHRSGNRGGKKTRKSGAGQGRRNRKELPWWVMLAQVGDIGARLPVRAARIAVPLNRENIARLRQQGNRMKKYQGRLVWVLPPVVHEKDLAWFHEQVDHLCRGGYTRYVLGHCSQYGLFLEQFDQGNSPELFGHYTLNLLNSAALHGVRHLGFRGALFSLETEQENLKAALTHFRWQQGRGGKKTARLQVGLYVYGRPPLFTARLDSDHFKNARVISPREEQFQVEHRDGLTLARSVLPFSLLNWQQELVVAGLDYLVLDLSGGPLRREASLVGALLGGGKKRQPVLTGNYRGTLV